MTEEYPNTYKANKSQTLAKTKDSTNHKDIHDLLLINRDYRPHWTKRPRSAGTD